MKVMIRKSLLRKPIVICTTAFAIAVGLQTLSETLGMPGLAADFFHVSGPWFQGAFEAVVVLVPVAIAARLVWELEDERRQSERKYATVVERAHDGILIIQKGRVVFANSRMVEISGFALEEARNCSFLDFVSPPDRDLVADAYRRRMSGEKGPDRYTIDILTKEGKNTPVEISSSLIEYDGEPADMAIVRDITKRKQAEETLRLERKNFRNSLETSPMGVMIVTLEGEVVYANPVILGMWGYSSVEELSAIPLERRMVPESSTRIRDLRDRKGRGVSPEDHKHETTIVRSDGQLRNLLARRTDIVWNEKRCSQITFEDITERKLAEEALRRERENFRNSLEMSPLGIQVVTFKGDLVYVNQTMLDMWGYDSFEELKRTPLERRFTPETAALIKEINEKRRQGKAPLQHEANIVCKDGHLRNLNSHNKEIIWNGERCAEIIYEDVTERKLAEEALRRERENFRNSLEMSPLGVQILAMNGEMIYANRTLLQMWGYESTEDLKAVPLQQRVTPDTFARIQARKRLQQGDVPIKFEHETAIVRKDGQIRHVQTYHNNIVWNGAECTSVTYDDLTERKQAEALYRTLADGSPIGVYIVQDHHLAYANPSFNAALGFNNGDMANVDPLTLVHPEDKSKVRNMAVAMLTGKTAHPYEYRYITKSGETRWALESVSSILYQGKRAALGNFQDLTEIKRTQEALREAHQQYENLVNNVGVGVFVWRPGTPGGFLHANHAMEEITGYSRDELIKMNLADVFVDPDDSQRVLKSFLYDRGKAPVECTLKKKDGTLAFTRSWLTSIRNDTGDVLHLEGVTEDITERKQAETKIRRAAEEWRTTFDSITDLISIHDKDNRLLRVNKAFANALGFRPQDVLGKRCHELLHGTDAPPESCPFLKAMGTGRPTVTEMSPDALHPGCFACWQESTSPIFDENHQAVGTVNIIKDITERKQMEQQLIMTDRLASIGELVSGIAHELNNPLTGVIGFSQLIMEKDIAEDIREDLTIVSNEAQRAARIVKNLLTFARKHAPVKQSSQLNNIIEDVLRLRAYEQRVNNIEVITHFDSDLPEIMADYFQIQQVFLNIIINAEYFMVDAHKHGTLTVVTERVGGVVRATFSDDGPGISPENMGRIFDPFFTTKEVGKGTGLGLSICHGIVTEHGGRIYVRSELGKGATFIVELPPDEVERGNRGAKGPGYAEQAANGAHSR